MRILIFQDIISRDGGIRRHLITFSKPPTAIILLVFPGHFSARALEQGGGGNAAVGDPGDRLVAPGASDPQRLEAQRWVFRPGGGLEPGGYLGPVLSEPGRDGAH